MPTISNLFSDNHAWMTVLILWSYSIYSLTDPEPPEPDCYDGQVQLASMSVNSQYSSDIYTQITSGYLEVCYQGSWISVCLNSTNNTNTSQLAELACTSINGFGGMSVKILIDIHYVPLLFILGWFEFRNITYIHSVMWRIASPVMPHVCLVTLQGLFAGVFLLQVILPTSLHSPTTITLLMIPAP